LTTQAVLQIGEAVTALIYNAISYLMQGLVYFNGSYIDLIQNA